MLCISPALSLLFCSSILLNGMMVPSPWLPVTLNRNSHSSWVPYWWWACSSPWAHRPPPSHPRFGKPCRSWTPSPTHTLSQNTSPTPPRTSGWIQAWTARCHRHPRIVWRTILHTVCRLSYDSWTIRHKERWVREIHSIWKSWGETCVTIHYISAWKNRSKFDFPLGANRWVYAYLKEAGHFVVPSYDGSMGLSLYFLLIGLVVGHIPAGQSRLPLPILQQDEPDHDSRYSFPFPPCALMFRSLFFSLNYISPKLL